MNKIISSVQYIILVVYVLFNQCLIGQSSNFIINKLTIKDGLPSNIIWNIEWSKNVYKPGDKEREIPVTFSLKEHMIKFIEEKLTAEWIKYKQS